MLIREFYANLKIDQSTMESNVLVRGRRAVLSKGLLSEVLKCPNVGICPDLGNDVITESYHKGEFVNELMGRKSSLCQIGLLGVDDRILFHIIDQVIMPKQNKGNDPNDTALFIMWCLKRTLRVNLPHIIMSNMKHIRDSSQELAYGMVITLIAKQMKVDLNEFEGEEHVSTKRKRKGEQNLSTLKRKKLPLILKKRHWSLKKLSPCEKSVPLSLSVETISRKAVPKTDIPSPESPTLLELLKDPKNEHSLFRMLQETLRASTFNHDTIERNNSLLKQILESIQATNGLLTSIQSLLQKQTSKSSVPEPILPLRITPQIEDVD
ncbi:hypothetical protein G2W53_022576 [Senna tora]|uniref:Putative plant transposon protein domain-containing protein n=1 Tax=Senna tora TaxID=362788 RepID=A0A834TMW9_9FABA|nr:hypothetical protein G2W53_022576 [Senna tora]